MGLIWSGTGSSSGQRPPSSQNVGDPRRGTHWLELDSDATGQRSLRGGLPRWAAQAQQLHRAGSGRPPHHETRLGYKQEAIPPDARTVCNKPIRIDTTSSRSTPQVCNTQNTNCVLSSWLQTRGQVRRLICSRLLKKSLATLPSRTLHHYRLLPALISAAAAITHAADAIALATVRSSHNFGTEHQRSSYCHDG